MIRPSTTRFVFAALCLGFGAVLGLTPGAAAPASAQGSAPVVTPELPIATIVAEGNQVREEEVLWLSPESRLQLEVPGAPANLQVALTLDGAPATPEAWQGGWSAGPHQAGARVTTPRGVVEVDTLAFHLDDAAPSVEILMVDEDRLPVVEHPPEGNRRNRRLDSRRESRRDRETRADRAPWALEWSSDGTRWLPLGDGTGLGAIDGWSVLVRSTEPGTFLRAVGRVRVGVGEDALELYEDERIAHLAVQDEGSGVAELRMRREGTDLVVEVADRVGNMERFVWAVEGVRGGR